MVCSAQSPACTPWRPRARARVRDPAAGAPAAAPFNPVTFYEPHFVCTHFPMAELELARRFAMESQARAIDGCNDIDELRQLTKKLLVAWYQQSDMTRHYGAQAMGLKLS